MRIGIVNDLPLAARPCDERSSPTPRTTSPGLPTMEPRRSPRRVVIRSISCSWT